MVSWETVLLILKAAANFGIKKIAKSKLKEAKAELDNGITSEYASGSAYARQEGTVDMPMIISYI